jgi:WD40 repeat protein
MDGNLLGHGLQERLMIASGDATIAWLSTLGKHNPLPRKKSKVNPSPPALLDLSAGVKLLRTIRGHTDWIRRTARSPDGMLASPSADKTIRLWDGKTGECLRVIHGHEGAVTTVHFDPSSRVLASGSEDKTAGIKVALDRWHNWQIGSAFLGSST